LATLASILTIGLLSAFVAGAGAASTAKKDSGTSYAAIDRTVGKTEFVSGYTVDKLFGKIAATYVTTVNTGTNGTTTVTGKHVTLFTSKGSLSGTATATLNLATGAISNGKLVLTHGTGGLKGHSFKGTFTGTSQLGKGLITFHYKGLYR
jgi:hypothetical protein